MKGRRWGGHQLPSPARRLANNILGCGGSILKGRITKMTAVVLFAVALVSCASEENPSSVATRQVSMSQDSSSDFAPEGQIGPEIEPRDVEGIQPRDVTDTESTPGSGRQTDGAAGGSGNDGVKGKELKGPPPLDLPWKPKVDVSATVTPRCVAPGGTMRLEVKTGPEAAVGYQAAYADGRGGAPEPFGAGYGGNDKGFTDMDGRFASSWVVASVAPIGRGRVDVIIAHDGEWGYADPAFRVDNRC